MKLPAASGGELDPERLKRKALTTESSGLFDNSVRLLLLLLELADFVAELGGALVVFPLDGVLQLRTERF